MKKILVIDDEKQWRDLYKMCLHGYDVKIIEASDGQKGLETAKAEKLDLIITDNKMPNMTGEEVAKLFRSDPDTKTIPIIMSTSMKMTQDMVAMVKLDVHEFIQKPFEEKDLLEKIEKLIGKLSPAASGGKSAVPKILISFEKNETTALVKTLLGQGYSMVEAKDSNDLLEKITGEKPKLIMSNAKTAGWSGYQGIRLLNKSLMDNIPVIVDMGDIKDDEITKIVAQRGKRFFLLQPIEMDDLSNTVKKLTQE